MVKIIARLELEETISFPDGHYTILAEACGLRTSVYPLSTKSLEELLTDALAMVNFHNHNVLSSCAIIDCCGFQIKRVFCALGVMKLTLLFFMHIGNFIANLHAHRLYSLL